MSASKKKGTAFETLTESYLRRMCGGTKVARQPPRGTADAGDLHLIVKNDLFVVECKNVANPTAAKIRKWCAEAQQEAVNASAEGWILVVHRAGCGRLNFGRNLAIVDERAARLLLGLTRASKPLALDIATLAEFINEKGVEA